MAGGRDLVARFVPAEQVSLEQAPAAAFLDGMTRRAVVLDAIELLHLAVSSTLFDGALRFGGAARSTAMTAYT